MHSFGPRAMHSLEWFSNIQTGTPSNFKVTVVKLLLISALWKPNKKGVQRSDSFLKA